MLLFLMSDARNYGGILHIFQVRTFKVKKDVILFQYISFESLSSLEQKSGTSRFLVIVVEHIKAEVPEVQFLLMYYFLEEQIENILPLRQTSADTIGTSDSPINFRHVKNTN